MPGTDRDGGQTLRTPKQIVEDLFRRLSEGDESAIEEFVAEDMINHAAGPQGREGWRQILATLDHDLGQTRIEHHHFIGEDDLVAHHMTMTGTHRASTMPLLSGLRVSGAPVAWTYIHIWKVAGGQVIEHWACRDDVGLLRQVGGWSHTE
jgi:predicted ester cyclase